MNKNNHHVFNLLVIFGLIFIPFKNVSAQDNLLTIFFTPDPAYLFTTPSNTIVVDINVTNAVDIMSYTIIVNYDETVAILQSYEVMDIFHNTVCQYQSDEPGRLGLGCVNWGGVEFNGDGTVVRLTFVGVGVGQTPLTFDALTNFANTSFEQVPIDRQHGVLHVIDPSEFQYLPMVMNVSIQGVVNRGGIGVNLGPGLEYSESYTGTTTNTPGNNLTFASVLVDSYRITTAHPRVLNISPELNKTFTPADGANVVPALRLAAGNAVWSDNKIDINDWTAVIGAYGNVSLNPEADVNFDGVVDMRDVALVAGNFGLTAEAAYAGWLP